jgi:hypothetical protein
MPFDNDQPWLFNRETIESFNAGQTGVYAIYNSKQWIYIGHGDIRQRLLDHFCGDMPSLGTYSPTHFRFEVTANSVTRERELIREYVPACNPRLS